MTPAQIQLVRNYLPLIPRNLGRILRGWARREREEALSWAHEALVLAAQSFDPALGVPFSGFASLKIRWFVLDQLRIERRARRRHIYRGATACDWEESDPLAGLRGTQVRPGDTGEEGVVGDESAQRAVSMLRDFAKDLPERQRIVVGEHYFGERDLKSIATDLGTSYPTVRRAHRAALRRLHARAAAAQLTPVPLQDA